MKHAAAKPLGAKSLLIREAIAANPELGNTELAALINDSDARKEGKIMVTAQDIASQRQAMKKAGAAVPAPTEGQASKGGRKSGRKPGRKPSSEPGPAPVAAAPAPAAGTADVVTHIEATREAVRKLGAD